MTKPNRMIAIKGMLLAFLAAVFYAISTPVSKSLLENVSPTMMAAFLYIGAGIGVNVIYLFKYKHENKSQHLTHSDLPYTIAMIILDIAAPVLMMLRISTCTASSASLLGNFEIVATTLIALIAFKEPVSRLLWIAIAFIVVSSALLSFEGAESLQLSVGSLFVIMATLCWGLENNCTRKISHKCTYQIVVLKGVFSGLGALAISLIIGEELPTTKWLLYIILLGFVVYGLSIFTYIRAQRALGATKTSAFYAVTPFIGVLLSFVFLHENIDTQFVVALCLMVIGTVFIVKDTLGNEHCHKHVHIIKHTHNGSSHVHRIVHRHNHEHDTPGGEPWHIHPVSVLIDAAHH